MIFAWFCFGVAYVHFPCWFRDSRPLSAEVTLNSLSLRSMRSTEIFSNGSPIDFSILITDDISPLFCPTACLPLLLSLFAYLSILEFCVIVGAVVAIPQLVAGLFAPVSPEKGRCPRYQSLPYRLQYVLDQPPVGRSSYIEGRLLAATPPIAWSVLLHSV